MNQVNALSNPKHRASGTVAWDMKYAGGFFNSCNITMLVDKDGSAQFPDFDILQPFAGTSLNMMRAAQPLHVPGFQERDYQREYRLGQGEYSGTPGLQDAVHSAYALIGLADIDNPNGQGASISLTLETLKHKLFKEWNYVELRAGCNAWIKHVVNQNEIVLSMRSKDVSPSALVDRETMSHMVNIRIPDQLLTPVRADFNKIDFQE